MSEFLRLPDGSPAQPLMSAIVQLGDLVVEHRDLMPPQFTDALFRTLCAAANVLLQAQAASDAAARAAVSGAIGGTET